MAYEIGQTCMLVNIGLTRAECASWVQAWGSIGAIVVAFAGPSLVGGLQRRRNRTESLRKAKTLAMGLSTALEELTSLLPFIAPDVAASRSHSFQSVVSAAEKISVEDLTLRQAAGTLQLVLISSEIDQCYRALAANKEPFVGNSMFDTVEALKKRVAGARIALVKGAGIPPEG